MHAFPEELRSRLASGGLAVSRSRATARALELRDAASEELLWTSPPCAHERAVADFAPGWQAWATFESAQPAGFSQFLGTFSVPDAPAEYNGQTLFMFTGLQNSNWVPGPDSPTPPADFEIIQPVLQFGPSAGGGGGYWTLASWYVTVDAGFLISPMIQVSAGQEIFGNMTQTGPTQWFIGSQVVGGQQVTLTANRQRLKYNPWAYVTLEVYSDSGDCSEYPTVPQVYQGMSLLTAAGKPVQPQWQANLNPDAICSEHVTIESPSHVTIHFGESA